VSNLKEKRSKLLSSFATKRLNAAKLKMESSEKVSPTKREFLDHINETVIAPALGERLQTKKLKQIVDGISEQILVLAMNGSDTKFGILGIFRSRTVAPGTRRNPLTNEPISHEMIKLYFEPTRKVKELLRAKRK
jgi:nucleoid DNA-binding protein